MSASTPSNGNGHDHGEDRPGKSGPPQHHGVPELPHISDLPTKKMSAAELQSAVDDSRRTEAARHRSKAKVLREQAAALEDELARAGTIIKELEARIATFEFIPRDVRMGTEVSEMQLLMKLVPDHNALRRYLRSDQVAMRTQAVEHEKAARWLLREMG
jgi:hypothetical protein